MVAEALNYGEWKATGKDRIIILEDTDGDGRADKRTVFYEGFNYVTGIEVGFGGVWVMSPPSLYFVPDRDGDDKPDGAPEVLFDGFGYKESRHNLANGFTWGPDGWLYGGHGRTSPSDVGRPGTPADKRIHCDGGVYRIHPTRLVFENFADGTTNPWGVDFDDYGAVLRLELRQPAPVPHDPGRPLRAVAEPAVEPVRLRAAADDRRPPALPRRRPAGDARHGRHAGDGRRPRPLRHAVYLGDAFPADFRNTVFMCNVHGRRINHDILKRKGSGYTASHGKDFMISADPWFMGVTLAHRPGRQRVRLRLVRHRRVPHLQAADADRAHLQDQLRRAGQGADRSGERDRRRAGEAATAPQRLVRAARPATAAGAGREAGLEGRARSTRQLREDARLGRTRRAAAAAGAVGAARHRRAGTAVRAAAARRSQRARPGVGGPVPVRRRRSARRRRSRSFAELAKSDPSPVVRLYLASALQRLPLDERWKIAEDLLSHAEDAADANLPLMYWYGIEPLVAADPARAMRLAATAKVPLVRQFIARRVADDAVAAGRRAT